MSALEEVLAAHEDEACDLNQPPGNRQWSCVCGQGLGTLDGAFDERRRAHLADAIRAWLTERLRDAGTAEAVELAIGRARANGRPGGYDDMAAAALAAVTALLTEERGQ